jgi:hypothetical protein
MVDLVHSFTLLSCLPNLVADSSERAIILTIAASELAPGVDPEVGKSTARSPSGRRTLMKDHYSFQRFAAITAIVSFFTGIASDVLQGIPVNFNSEFPIDPAIFLAVGNHGATLLRWGLILDMLGYYLPLLPIALFIQNWLKTKNPLWIRFYTTCGLGYILIGAVGAIALAVVQPPLIASYTQASADQRQTLETIFGTIWSIVYGGMWNILGEGLIGIWFIGIGSLLRSERRVFGIITMIVGASGLLDSLGNILGLESLALVGVSTYIILAPIWALWLGIDLLRKPVQVQAP